MGSLNVDLVARVPSLPRPGETVLGTRLETFRGGKGANEAVALAIRGGRRVLLNAAPAAPLDRRLLRGLEALVVNESEAAALLGRPAAGLEAAGELHAAGARLAVVTLGAAGAALCDAAGP